MKAIAYHKFGNTEVLQTVDESAPAIKADEVLVKVNTVSINPMDWKIRKGEMKLMSGSRFPKRTGAEFAGIIEATGTAVTNFKIGDAVFGTVKNTMKDGALAEYVAVTAQSVWKKPDDLNFHSAASIPIAGAAAVTIMEKIGTINSQTEILINGATGGLGMFLLQLLKRKGAGITAVTSSTGAEVARRWGATSVIDYTAVDVLSGHKHYDVIIDLSGKMEYKNARQIMKPKSRFINPTPKPIQIPGSILNNLFTPKEHIVILSAPTSKNIGLLLNEVNLGLQIAINKVFPFAASVEAYQYAEKGGVIGKVVIEL
jgi:NADPH:quinone reductase-like Zn-dependent oxidoreductase